MAVITHVFPQLDQQIATKQVDLSSDTLAVLLVASGSYTWNSTAQASVYVSDFLAGSGAGALTEVSVTGTNYTRKDLTSVTLATSGLVTTLGCASPEWASATFTALYACWFDNAGASDSAREVIAYTDFGGSQTYADGTCTLTVGSGGLVTWTAS